MGKKNRRKKGSGSKEKRKKGGKDPNPPSETQEGTRSQVAGNKMLGFIGCATVLGILVIAVVLASRIPSKDQIEILRYVLNLLNVVLVALFGGQIMSQRKP